MTTSVNNNVGTTSATSAANAASTALGNTMNQADFLKLLTTQLQAQDPTNPMDNSQFVSQLAQFSQLASTQDLNTSLNSLSSQITSGLQSSQVLGSVGLVGRHVLVPSASLSYAGSALDGAVGITSTSSDVQLVIKDGSGKVVRTLDLGAQQSGLARFDWDGTDDSGNPVPAGDYSITAADESGNALSTYADGTVSGVGYGGSSVGTYVQVNGVGGVPLSSIAQIN